jgi:hypothetical protein
MMSGVRAIRAALTARVAPTSLSRSSPPGSSLLTTHSNKGDKAGEEAEPMADASHGAQARAGPAAAASDGLA